MNIRFNEFIPFNNRFAIFSRALNTTEEYYRNLKTLLRIKRVAGYKLIRVGNANDGGYIMVDNLRGGVAYSFGINDEISWDADMARRGYDVYMYDMTIDRLPHENERFHFFREGIAGRKIPKRSLDTLESFVARNGHGDNDNMILKMDVEGAEWDFLTTVPFDLLERFDQIVIEVHNIIKPKSDAEIRLAINLIKKVNLTHSLVHVHGNNCGHFLAIDNIGIFPDVLELTYVKTANYNLYDDENIHLPLSVDYPNSANRQEISLGYWNRFV